MFRVCCVWFSVLTKTFSLQATDQANERTTDRPSDSDSQVSFCVRAHTKHVCTSTRERACVCVPATSHACFAVVELARALFSAVAAAGVVVVWLG